MDDYSKAEIRLERAQAEAEKDAHDVAASQSVNMDDYINNLWIERKLREFQLFPQYCEVTRAQNRRRIKELEESGVRGKYSGKLGFSDKGDFVFKYEIPKPLYDWCRQIISRQFWDKENEKIANAMMYKIIGGEEPWSVFVWLKNVYGMDFDGRIKKLQRKIQVSNNLVNEKGGSLHGSDNQTVGESQIIKEHNIL